MSTSIADLTVDEFMNEDFQTDSENEGPTAEIKSVKKKKKTKKSKGNVKATHQKQLDNLKEKDPEFYQFLKEEESNLLKFGENIDIDSSEDEDDDDLHELPTKLLEASDSEEEEQNLEEMDVDEGMQSDQVTVTQQMIDRWEEAMDSDKMSIRTLYEVMQAYHAAVHQFAGKSQDQDQTKKKKKKVNKYTVSTGQIFNEIAGLCIRKLIPYLSKFLKYNTKGKKATANKSKLPLPSSMKAWGSVKQSLKVYLEDVCKLVEALLDIAVQGTMLRHALLLVPFYLCYPKLTKNLYKILIKLWSSSSDESIRVLAFLILNRIVNLEKKQHLKKVLKQSYLAYVANCKFTSPSTLPMINFMQRTLCELYAIDTAVTYELAFLYIRQLAIHLRQAMTQHKKESYQAVYNWQYVHCIELWSHVLATLLNRTLQPLIFPLVQVSLGTIDLIPTPRYFPLRFHIVRCLVTLGDRTNTYVPLLSYILRPLQLAEFTKVRNNTMHKKIIFATILKLSNSELKDKSYQETVIDEVYELLMSYLNTQSHTIAFPEMTVPAVLTIKKYVKSCKGQGYAKIMKQILDKVTENSEFITLSRNNVTFNAADFDAVESWEKQLKSSGVPFHRQFASYHKKRERELQQEAVDKSAVVAERLPTIDREKFMAASKAKDREEFRGLFAEMEDHDTETMEADFASAVDQSKQKKRKRVVEPEEVSEDDDFSDMELEDVITETKQKIVLPSQVSKPVPNEDGEVPESGDIVNDFVFSDDE